ncbi:MAG: ATP-binding cassette domain-containing protein, partial [Stellaceae bacterium]
MIGTSSISSPIGSGWWRTGRCAPSTAISTIIAALCSMRRRRETAPIARRATGAPRRGGLPPSGVAGDLSGGEKARLLLGLATFTGPNLMILDEPTNHLDIDSRRALLDALNDYEGAVVLITHDRSLMEMVADRLWLTADGAVTPFDGDMEDYARFVLD